MRNPRMVLAVVIVVFAVTLLLRYFVLEHPKKNMAPPPSPASYERIISMSPGATETLFAVGAGEKVFGVTTFCVYPPETARKTRVGAFLDPNYEVIISLKPDLVVLMPSHTEHKRQLDTLGIHSEIIDQSNVGLIVESIRKLGQLSGMTQQGDTLANRLTVLMDAMRKQTAGLPKPRVLMTAGRDVGAGTLDQVYCAGPKTFLNDLIAIAGGVNAITESPAEYPPLSGEAIVRLDPEVIIDTIPDPATLGTDATTIMDAWRVLPTVSAVKNNRLHVLTGDHVQVPGPRIELTLKALIRLIHPESPETQP